MCLTVSPEGSWVFFHTNRNVCVLRVFFVSHNPLILATRTFKKKKILILIKFVLLNIKGT